VVRGAIVAVAEGCACCGSEPEHGEPLRPVCRTCFEQLVKLVEQPERKLPRLLTIAEAAAVLGVRPRTVRAWIHRGDLTAVQIAGDKRPNGKRYRVRRSDLARFMATRATVTHDH